MEASTKKHLNPYQPPKPEPQAHFCTLVGVSLPIATNSLLEPMGNGLEGGQQ
jgi:hypothetical protein